MKVTTKNSTYHIDLSTRKVSGGVFGNEPRKFSRVSFNDESGKFIFVLSDGQMFATSKVEEVEREVCTNV